MSAELTGRAETKRAVDAQATCNAKETHAPGREQDLAIGRGVLRAHRGTTTNLTLNFEKDVEIMLPSMHERSTDPHPAR
jgi:hypothetical protein